MFGANLCATRCRRSWCRREMMIAQRAAFSLGKENKKETRRSKKKTEAAEQMENEHHLVSVVSCKSELRSRHDEKKNCSGELQSFSCCFRHDDFLPKMTKSSNCKLQFKGYKNLERESRNRLSGRIKLISE